MSATTRYTGNDNYGRPKSEYLAKIAAMDDASLERETYMMVYHSARCSNNPRADWHWMVDACYDECKKRPGDIYQAAWDACYRDHAR